MILVYGTIMGFALGQELVTEGETSSEVKAEERVVDSEPMIEDDAEDDEEIAEAKIAEREEEGKKELEILRENLSSVELKEDVGLVYTYAFAEGQYNAHLGKEYDLQTPFEIGSVSKVFTSLLLADMVARGEVSLDTTVGEILPDQKMRTEVAAITLEQLATHTSGLPRMPPNLGTMYILRHAKNPYAEYDRKKLHKGLSRAKITEEGFAYSNFGAGLLGDLLSMKAGKSYCTLVEERIVSQMNVDSLHCSNIPENIAQPHLWTGDENPVWEFGSLAGAGALRANSEDLSLFLGYIDVNFPEGDLFGEGFTNTLKTHYKDAGSEVGLGWMIIDVEGMRCYFHNGMTGGSSSFVASCPDQEFGVVLLMNQQDLKMTLTEAGLNSVKELVQLYENEDE